MIHRGYHWADRLAVAEGEDGDLRAGEEFFNDDALSGPPKAAAHCLTHCCLGLVAGRCHSHALSERQAVGLDHDGQVAGGDVCEGRGFVVVNGVTCGGDAVACHEGLGERLRALDLRGGLGRTEAADTCGGKGIHSSGHERVVRSDDGVVHAFLKRIGDERVDVHRANGDAGDPVLPRDAGVARRYDNLVHARAASQLAYDRMLASARSYDQNLHCFSFPRCARSAVSSARACGKISHSASCMTRTCNASGVSPGSTSTSR